MANNPIRRAQLIAPFGVGAMVVVRDGTSLITSGLDQWYKYEEQDGIARTVDTTEFQVEEWRLQQLLGVDHFRLPPDFREAQWGENVPNSYLRVPFLRFPQWHFCPGCRLIRPWPLSSRGRIKCPECESNKKTRYMAQVPFVAMCDNGHLQDFPWREWVHATSQPTCDKSLRLIATGGASLAAQKVVCDCGKERTLAQITGASQDGTETALSKSLEEGTVYLCRGQRPWLGPRESVSCSRPLRGSLRSASNVYFAHIRSAIYLPRGNNDVPSNLVTLLEEPPLSTLIHLISGLGGKPAPADLRKQHFQLLQTFTDKEIERAIDIILSGYRGDTNEGIQITEDDDGEVALRRAEYDVLRTSRDEEQLMIRASNLNDYTPFLRKYFTQVMLVNKLRETRALAGFTRVFPEIDVPFRERRALLRSSQFDGEDKWLPAYVVYGEGIFLELNERELQAWEQQQIVAEYLAPLLERYSKLLEKRKARKLPLGPRFILLHTLAHLIMNRLTFECGYSSAALRERLYVSDDLAAPMAGILIYTAAGDAEGTMGGLVRMGKPGKLETVIQQALADAQWCSTDPVCMEMGLRGGQGPDSCNLAACHNCSLVPETACEEFNRFLDRGVVIGQVENRDLGFFSDLNV